MPPIPPDVPIAPSSNLDRRELAKDHLASQGKDMSA